MKIEKLAQLPNETVFKILEILRKDQRTIDGVWFLAVEEFYGLERAVEFDAFVWGKLGGINARRLQGAFGLAAPGIPTLIKAIGLDPLWLFFGYEVDQLSVTLAVMRVTDCLAQKGRLRGGKDNLWCEWNFEIKEKT